MIKFENTITPSAEQWMAIINGLRNPMNSWDKSDSKLYIIAMNAEGFPEKHDFWAGDNDLDLMTRLRNAGTDHRKFMRMITVYVDITAPLYWWKEFDTYKVGTVANSCSTMHKIHEKEFTLEDFSCEHLDRFVEDTGRDVAPVYDFKRSLEFIIEQLNDARRLFLKTKEKKYWWQMIQILPTSYNQKRTVMLNYEILANIYKSRKNHKLDEWRELCEWIEDLPYSELIIGGADNE